MKTAIIFLLWSILVLIPANFALTCNSNYFHVDDFAGLGGGNHGQLVPINGAHSLWCGVTASQSGYPSDGYGNGWDECWESCSFSVDPDSGIYISYSICYDTEPGYDFAYFDFHDGANWITLRTYNSRGCTQEFVSIPGSFTSIKLRFRVVSDGGWSDQDGLYDSDGAIIVDDISVFAASQLINFEDFECEAVGDQRTLDGIWVAGAAGACLDTIPCVPDTTAFNNSSCDSSCVFSGGSIVQVSFEDLVTGASVEGLGAAHPDLNITSLANPNYPSSCAPTGAYVIEEGVGTKSYGGGPSALKNECLTGVKGFGDDESCVLDYQFTFVPGKVVDCFSIRMLDYGDYLPYSPADTHEVLLTAYDAGMILIDQDALSFTGGRQQTSGDACTAAEGEPGNLILSVMGSGIKQVDLTFTKSPDPNIGFDDIAFCIDSLHCVTAPIGLRGWWGGEGNENDISGYGNHGSFIGPSDYSISPKVGTGAFSFSGASYVNVPDNPSLDFGTGYANGHGDFSIDAWVKLPNPSGSHVILSKLPPQSNPAPWGYSFYVNNGKLAILLITELTGVLLTDNSSFVVPAGQWTHVAVTVDRKPSNPAVTFFINGLAGGSLPAQQEIAADISNDVDLHIGPLAAGGELDEVELIARVLSAGEINGIFMADYAGKCLPDDIPIVDCNSNGIDDKIDIASGTSVDTDGNDVPDECETFWVPSGDDAIFCNLCTSAFFDTIYIVNLGGTSMPLTIDDTCSVFNIFFGGGTFNIAPGDSHQVAIRFNPVDTGSTTCIIPTGYYPGIICTGTTETLSGIEMLNYSVAWEAGYVVLRWTMGGGIGVTDFEIQRKENENEGFTLINRGPIEQAGDSFIYLDETAKPGKKYIYRITAKKGDAQLAMFETSISTPVLKFALFQNYPNPFSATTKVVFSLDHHERAQVRIYDVTGRLVRTLVDRRLKVGIHRETWDGRDESGRIVASGIYFYRLQAGSKVLTKKMVLLK
jgi:hypothetical protein